MQSSVEAKLQGAQVRGREAKLCARAGGGGRAGGQTPCPCPLAPTSNAVFLVPLCVERGCEGRGSARGKARKCR